MRYASLLSVLGAAALTSLPIDSHAFSCTHLFSSGDIEAIIAQTVSARDAAQRALGDGGARREEVERLVRHLDLAITGTADPEIDGLKELLDYHVAHPASPGQLFGGTNRVIGRLHAASQVAAIATAARGPVTPVTMRWDAYNKTTLALEQLVALWRPISQCKIDIYS